MCANSAIHMDLFDTKLSARKSASLNPTKRLPVLPEHRHCASWHMFNNGAQQRGVVSANIDGEVSMSLYTKSGFRSFQRLSAVAILTS